MQWHKQWIQQGRTRIKVLSHHSGPQLPGGDDPFFFLDLPFAQVIPNGLLLWLEGKCKRSLISWNFGSKFKTLALQACLLNLNQYEAGAKHNFSGWIWSPVLVQKGHWNLCLVLVPSAIYFVMNGQHRNYGIMLFEKREKWILHYMNYA